MQQTAEERLRLRDRINRKWEDGTQQKSLLDLDFEFIEKTDETYTPPTAVRKKRTIADVQNKAKEKIAWTQPSIFGAPRKHTRKQQRREIVK